MTLTRSIFLTLCIALVGCAHTKVASTKLGELPPAPQRLVLIDNLGAKTPLYQPFYSAFEQTMQQCGVAVTTTKVDPLALNDNAIKKVIGDFNADLILEFGLQSTTRGQSRCESILSFKLGSVEQRKVLWMAVIQESGQCGNIKALQALAKELAGALHQDGLLTSCSALATSKPDKP